MQTTDRTAARAGAPVRALATTTRVRAGVDGRLTAECPTCRLDLEQLPGTDVARALRAFDAAHGEPPHEPTLPWGWRAATRP